MILNSSKKPVSESAKMTYLNSVTHLHINYDLVLAQKTAFLIAVAALILTISITGMLAEEFIATPILIRLSAIIIALGTAIGVLLLLSAENFKPSRLVNSFHPLSLEEFHAEAKTKFEKDIERLTSSEDAMIKDYSDQILAMKEDMFKKTRVIKLARKFIIYPLFISTILVLIQLYGFLL